MNMNRKKVQFYIVFVGVILLFVFLFFAGKRSERKRQEELDSQEASVMEELQKDTVYTEEEIYNRLEAAIIADETDNIYMSVPGKFSEDDIKRIGRSIDPFLGRATVFSYSTSTTKEGDGPEISDYYVGINYDFKKTDEYWVYEAITEGKEIPADRENAIKIKEVCESFIKSNIKDSMSDYEKELVIHDYIVNNCTYGISDANDGSEFNSYGVLINNKAVCEGYARTAALLLKCCGIEAKLVVGHTNDNNAADTNNPDGSGSDGKIINNDGKPVDGHMWNQVKIDGVWYNLDVTWDDPLSDEEILEHTYFNVDDTILSNNHEWDKAETEVCSSNDANYYSMNNLFFHSESEFHDYVGSQLSNGNLDTIECAVTKANIDEDSMSFIFEYGGISSYQVNKGGVDGYNIITLSFNQ